MRHVLLPCCCRSTDKKKYDWTDETVHWEGGPAAGGLVATLF
jgi:hypothetical protein